MLNSYKLVKGIFQITILAIAACIFFTGCPQAPVNNAASNDSVSLPYPEFSITRTPSFIDNGFFVMAPFRMAKTANRATSTLMIVGGTGDVLYAKGNVTASDFKMQSNGVFTYWNGRCFILLDENLMEFDSVKCVDGASTDSHDFLILPNGNFVLLGLRTEVKDFSSFKITTVKNWTGGKKTNANYGIVQELSPDKKLVYEWNSKGEYALSDFDPVYFNDTAKLDLPHFNSVAVDSLGNYLLSARYTNEIIYVNKATGKIDWRLGGNRSSFVMTGEPYPFLGQHDARFQPNGNILLFDNGYSSIGQTHPARSVEYKLDHAAKTATCVWAWSWQTNLVSEATGTTQSLANGFSLLNFGKIQFMSHNILCAVADENKKVVFQIAFSDTMGSYSTHFYEHLPVSLKRPEIRISQSKNATKLTAIEGKPCVWSNGELGVSITVREPGTYQAFLMRADSSYVGSGSVEITAEMIGANGNK